MRTKTLKYCYSAFGCSKKISKKQGKFSLRIDKRGSGEYNNTVVNLLMLRKSKSQSVKCHGDGELPRGRKADLFGHCPAVSCGSMAASRFILHKGKYLRI